MKKRKTDNFRKRKEKSEVTTMIKSDCNGGINATRCQRTDNIPLLNTSNTKRWHSLETVRADDTSDGCDVDLNEKKSLGHNNKIIIRGKSWLAMFGGLFQNGNQQASLRHNGSSILLETSSPALPPKSTQDHKSESIV